MRFLHRKLEVITTKQKDKHIGIVLLNFIKDMPVYFLLVIEIYIPLKMLVLPDIFDTIINVLFVFALVIQIVRISNEILVRLLKNVFKKQVEVDKTSQNAIQLIVKVFVWVLGLLLILVNLGVEVTPLLASLGIGGIAIAFALQHILVDLFSSFSILVSKPFGVGDWIVVGDKSGSVTSITLKATYIHALTGETIIIPNSQVLAGSINNYGKMEYRRKRIAIGVTYQTPVNKLKKIPKLIEKVISQIPEEVEFEWTSLSELGDHSINYTISYKLLDPSYDFYRTNNEQIILKILEVFEKEGIEIAYPTQVIHTPDLIKKK